ncbi:MAG: hypothetical protein K8W52_45745 [Deltaproteobacteria bacterium]|nr:hypothetical protein [Deltaproteobacteria bacterium]
MDGQARPTDWTALAVQLRSVGAGDGFERGSDTLARAAIVQLLGDDAMRDAVDFYVTHRPGSELARSVLWLLHPWSAMQRCHEIFASDDADVDERRSAVELLRVVADRRVLPWIPLYLADPDPSIRGLGIGVVDQLLFADLIEFEDGAEMIAHACADEDPHVREAANRILADREETNSAPAP